MTDHKGESGPAIRWLAEDVIWNFDHDFNQSDWFIARFECPRVESYVRLVDLDPGGGWCIAQVTAIEASKHVEHSYICTYRLVGGTWTDWPDSFVGVTVSGRSESRDGV